MHASSAAPQDRFASRRAAFRALHQSGFFVIPNPWDVGTSRYLRSLGFKALATTSSGFAFSHGLPDADWAVPRGVGASHACGAARSQPRTRPGCGPLRSAGLTVTLRYHPDQLITCCHADPPHA